MQSQSNVIHTIVDLTTITPIFEIYLYKIFEIPQTIPVQPGSKVDNYVKTFLQQITSGLNDPSEFIINSTKHNLLGAVFSEDLMLFTQNVDELRGIALYTLNHLTHSVNYSSEYIYLVDVITRDYMVISTHQINKEADLLVYS